MSNVSSTDGGYHYYQRKIGDLEDEMRTDAKRSRERMREQTDDLDANYQRALNERDRETEDTADRIRRNTNEEISRERENARTDVEREKARTYDRFGKAQAEIAAQQKRANESIRKANDDFEHRMEVENRSRDHAEESRALGEAASARQSSERLHDGYKRENEELRQNIKDLLAHENRYAKEKGQATVEVRREIEGEAKARERGLQTGYQDQIDKLKRDLATSRVTNNDNLNGELAKRDMATAALVERINADHHAEDLTAQEEYSRSARQQKELADASQRHSEDRLGQQYKVAVEERENSLRKQARAYGETMRTQRMDDNQKIGQLESELQKQRTTADVAEISPAAEAAIRKQTTDEYEKTEQANMSRMQERDDQLREGYRKSFADGQQSNQDKITRLQTQHNLETEEERAAFLTHVNELEQDQAISQNKNESSTNRQIETLTRSHTQTLEKQRQEYEQLLFQSRADAQQKMTTLQQKADFDAKMAQRGFVQQQNTLIREYEKKLNDQKNTYEDQIDELKTQLTLSTRDGERRTKQMLDDQSRGYEQRIQQLEFQSKERERMISENYQDQIEKIKRSNALLIQKKG